MNWPLMRQTLASAIPLMTGLPPASVVWKGSLEEASVVVGTRAVLSVASLVGVGIDEERLEADTVHVLGAAKVNNCGQRAFTWSIQIECQNQGPDNTARMIADFIRARIKRRSIKTLLETNGIAIGQVLGTTYRDYLASGRMISWAAIDFRLLAAENDLDRDEGTGYWIGEAQISGTVKDTGGDTLGTITEDVNTLT